MISITSYFLYFTTNNIPEMGGLQATVAAPFWQKLPFCHRKIGNYGGKTVDIKQRML